MGSVEIQEDPWRHRPVMADLFSVAWRQRPRRGNCGLSLKMKNRLVTDITPGEILEEEFLKPMGITQYRLARDLGVPPRRINEIAKGKRAITADTALRLGRYFRMSPQFWLNLQTHYDLQREEQRLGRRLAREVKVLMAA